MRGARITQLNRALLFWEQNKAPLVAAIVIGLMILYFLWPSTSSGSRKKNMARKKTRFVISLCFDDFLLQAIDDTSSLKSLSTVLEMLRSFLQQFRQTLAELDQVYATDVYLFHTCTEKQEKTLRDLYLRERKKSIIAAESQTHDLRWCRTQPSRSNYAPVVASGPFVRCDVASPLQIADDAVSRP